MKKIVLKFTKAGEVISTLTAKFDGTGLNGIFSGQGSLTNEALNRLKFSSADSIKFAAANFARENGCCIEVSEEGELPVFQL